jgi:hypothetical protein
MGKVKGAEGRPGGGQSARRLAAEGGGERDVVEGRK